MRSALIACIGTLIGGEAHASPPMLDPRPGVAVTGDGLSLEWRVPPVQIAAQADGTLRIDIAGYRQIDQPGQVRLPYTSVLIALPPDAQPAIAIVQHDEIDLPLTGPLAVARRPEGVLRDASGQIVGGEYAPVHPGVRQGVNSLAEDTKSAEADCPSGVCLEELGHMRGVRLARLTFYPARPEENRLRVTTYIRVSVVFNSVLRAPSLNDGSAGRAQPEGCTPPNCEPPDDPLLSAIRSAVVNPDHVQPAPRDTFRIPHSAFHIPQSSITNPQSAFAIEVSSPGLTALAYSALQAAGFPVSTANPFNLHLTRAGNEIAAEWNGDADTAFEPGERLLFYADPRFSRYSTTDVYFLSVEATPGLRLSSRAASPAGYPAGSPWVETVAESNLLYTPECYCGPIPPGYQGDRFTWDALARPGRASASYPVQLAATNTAQAGFLTLWLIGYTDIPTATLDHRVNVLLNNVLLGRVEWNGKQAAVATLPITPGLLLAGSNTISLSLPGIPGIGVEGAWLDAFSIHFVRGAAAAGASIRFSTSPTLPAAAVSLPRRLYLPLVMKNFSPAPNGKAYSVTLANAGPYRAYDVSDPDRPASLTGYSVAGNTITIGESSSSLHRYLVTSEAGALAPTRVRPVAPL
ncbi:MAG TPA: hypothetical protein VIK33_04180, partial [Anaerolineae bacterium]